MTQRWILALAVCGLTNTSFADGDKPHARMKPGSYPDRAAAWKKFTLKDVALGGVMSKVPGFTCGPDPVAAGYTTYRQMCVKFLDDRCKGKPTKIHHIRSTGDVDKGQNCFMDEGSGGTYLDRKFTSPPLSAISIVGTDTSVPIVYEINYTFANDVLTDDSNLGKALIQKYGAPTSRNPPLQMNWTSGQVQLRASCGTTQGPSGEFCTLQVTDDGLLDTERTIQQEADDAAQKSNAPPAPKL